MSRAERGFIPLRVDWAGYHNAPPRFSHAGDAETVTLSYALDYDPTSAKVLAVRVVNALSGI